jgi:hypothetical protein
MLTTTLQKLKDAGACVDRYKHLRKAVGKSFGMSTNLPLARILATNGLDDCLWAMDHAVDGGDKICRLFVADCAEHVQHIWLKYYPKNTRPAEAIKAARAYARGQITAAAVEAAVEAASRARSAAVEAAARAAAKAVEAALVEAAARAAAKAMEAAARAAATAEEAAWAAATAVEAAARAAATDYGEAAVDAEAEQKWQTERLAAYLNDEVTEDWGQIPTREQ